MPMPSWKIKYPKCPEGIDPHYWWKAMCWIGVLVERETWEKSLKKVLGTYRSFRRVPNVEAILKSHWDECLLREQYEIQPVQMTEEEWRSLNRR